jgi:phospholipid transport system substrate-binding protein
MPAQRAATIFAMAAALLAASPGAVGTAWAQSHDQAVSFVRDSAGALVAIANGSGSAQEKHQRIREVLDRSVDLPGIARVCLGRFWHTASPQQQLQYTTLSRDLIVTKIADHLGDYQGVRLTMGPARTRDGTEIVSTTVERPGDPADEVDWVVSTSTGQPKIVDLLAEGTSMRETQGSDFAAYLASHQYDVHQLIEGLQQKVATNN